MIRRTLASRMASRMAPCPAEPAADAAGLESLRVLAEKRAAAAEIIAQEANAVRLRALLEAARGQTANRNIRSAEERFAAAKDEWEAVRQVLQAEPDPYAEPIDATQPSHAMPPSAAVPAWLPKLAEVSRRKELLIGGPLVFLAGVIAVAAYLHSDGAAATAAGRLATPPSALALDAPAIAGPEGAAGPDPAAGTAPQPAVAGSAAETVPSAQTVKRAQPGKVVKKKAKQQVVAPPPPRSRPEPEELASGVLAPADEPRAWNAVE
ncbi:MAG: hypothetical protein GEU87_20825 [Alphaproteobacteria bacterium]|nr:hypothetical protein [Alphaproteobacteria bacterium]